jgi:chromate reductase, NAD(P)H dehydrogenase (quinone)
LLKAVIRCNTDVRPIENAKRQDVGAAAMNIHALSGSLRVASINSMLLRATARLAPRDINVSIFNGLGELPLFNPDLEASLPANVVTFHRAVADADALLFASPEYAHGVTGTIKNALDWLVGFEPFASEFMAALSASPRAHHADDALRETLRPMAAVIVESASISIPWLGAGLDESAMMATPSIAGAVRESLRAMQHAFVSHRGSFTTEFPIR